MRNLYLHLILFLLSYVNVGAICPMAHEPCSCNITAQKEYELKCKNFDSKMVEEALGKVSISSDYQMKILSLENITLSEEKLKIPGKFCYQIVNLTAISTRSPKLNFLDCSSGLPNLKRLDIVKNQDLKSIGEDFSDDFPKLKFLNVEASNLEKISGNAFSKISGTLLSMKIAADNLNNFPMESLLNLTSLQVLSFKSNAIKSISDLTVKELRNNLKSLKNISIEQLGCSCGLWKSNLQLWLQEKSSENSYCTFGDQGSKFGIPDWTEQILCQSNKVTDFCCSFLNVYSALILSLYYIF